MSGFMQTSFYFGYMLCVCFGAPLASRRLALEARRCCGCMPGGWGVQMSVVVVIWARAPHPAGFFIMLGTVGWRACLLFVR